jgi:hypothetical protein
MDVILIVVAEEAEVAVVVMGEVDSQETIRPSLVTIVE